MTPLLTLNASNKPELVKKECKLLSGEESGNQFAEVPGLGASMHPGLD
jgi:hypothetical protein